MKPQKVPRPVFVVPFDGYKSDTKLIGDIAALVRDKEIAPYIAYIKLNDALHSGSPDLVERIYSIMDHSGSKHIKIFFDLKLPDVSATNLNILSHQPIRIGSIITIDASVTAETVQKIRTIHPMEKLALYSVPTDMSEEECTARYGMPPALKIYTDWHNIRSQCKMMNGEPFDMVVCSPWENEFLKKVLPGTMKVINPGIRDEWMFKADGSGDHQKRIMGVCRALDAYADLIVLGAPLMKGNPEGGISVAESRRRTIEEAKKSRVYNGIDLLELLKSHDGYYESPQDENGNFIGPVVAYAGTYKEGDDGGSKPQQHSYVGNIYLNFAKVDSWPLSLEAFAQEILDQSLTSGRPLGNVFLGAPMGGLQLATTLARLSTIHRSIFTDKEVIALADTDNGKKEESRQLLKRYTINEGDHVVVVEDVINNFSTTDKMKAEIESHGGILKTIVCAINRSGKTEWNGIPVVAAIDIPSNQYKQSDPMVRERIKAGNVVWNPKKEWGTLKAAMEQTV